MVLKSKLFSKRIDYKEVMIGRDITREEFMEKFPGVRQVPHLVEEDELQH
jgi:glutaredoxin